jgi:ribosome hibernation promoting factor
VQITVTGRHVNVTEEIKTYAQDKAEKLLKFYDRIQAIDVVLDHEGDQFHVEILVSAGSRHEFVAKETGDDTFAIIDTTIDKLERQLTKHKEKSRNRMHVNRKQPPV